MKSIREMIGNVAGGYGLDTLTVLFFLTMEFGRGVQVLSLDGALMSFTIAMLVVLPYFLPMLSDAPSFGRWMAVRSAAAASGLAFGLAVRQTAGTEAAVAAASLPMTFLILAGMVSCYIQFYGLMKLRLVK